MTRKPDSNPSAQDDLKLLLAGFNERISILQAENERLQAEIATLKAARDEAQEQLQSMTDIFAQYKGRWIFIE